MDSQQLPAVGQGRSDSPRPSHHLTPTPPSPISDKELAPAFGGQRHHLSSTTAIRSQPVLPTRLSLLYCCNPTIDHTSSTDTHSPALRRLYIYFTAHTSISFVAFAFVRSIASPHSTFATPEKRHHIVTSSTCRRRRCKAGRTRRRRHRTVLPVGSQRG
jgi:hypothetical protein